MQNLPNPNNSVKAWVGVLVNYLNNHRAIWKFIDELKVEQFQSGHAILRGKKTIQNVAYSYADIVSDY